MLARKGETPRVCCEHSASWVCAALVAKQAIFGAGAAYEKVGAVASDERVITGIAEQHQRARPIGWSAQVSSAAMTAIALATMPPMMSRVG